MDSLEFLIGFYAGIVGCTLVLICFFIGKKSYNFFADFEEMKRKIKLLEGRK